MAVLLGVVVGRCSLSGFERSLSWPSWLLKLQLMNLLLFWWVCVLPDLVILATFNILSSVCLVYDNRKFFPGFLLSQMPLVSKPVSHFLTLGDSLLWFFDYFFLCLSIKIILLCPWHADLVFCVHDVQIWSFILAWMTWSCQSAMCVLEFQLGPYCCPCLVITVIQPFFVF